MSAEQAPPSRPAFSDADKAHAKRCFEHARKAGETRNYDYAIELYLQGLERWTEAVEEGLKMLRTVGVARRQSGGKAPGFFESRKYSTNGKDARINLLHALRLYALDPGNLSHLEAVLVNAARASMPYAVHWIGPILWSELQHDKKITVARCQTIYQALDRGGQFLEADGDYEKAGELYRVAQLVADLWRQHNPNSADAHKAVSDASSKLTIVKGRFGTSDDFRSSLKDGEAQRDRHDQGKVVQAESRLKELISKARSEYEADRDSANKLLMLCELLTRSEDESEENEAIRQLLEATERTGHYSLRMKADDIRIRQLRRRARDAFARHQAAPQDAALLQAAEAARRGLLEDELKIFHDRADHYPSDQRIKYEIGQRLFELHRFDEAIPVFQQAQADPRRRNHARLYIGRCFFEKHFYPQAVELLTAARQEHELAEDDLGKALAYWLGRAQEVSGHPAEAAQLYGKLIQIDYNYRDARQRFEKLNAAGMTGTS